MLILEKNNPHDGFSVFATALAAVFVAAGFLLVYVGGVSLLAMVPVALIVIAAYLALSAKGLDNAYGRRLHRLQRTRL